MTRSLAGLLLCCIAPAAQLAHAANIHEETIHSNNTTRSYYLVTPDRPSKSPMPLVLVLHGHGGTAANALGLKGTPSPLAEWIPITDREHIVVVALQGDDGGDGKPGWNDCRSDAPGNPPTDDVRFAHDVVITLQQRGIIDTKRLYVMGMSNGAMMAQRLALELDPPVAAFASVSGSMAAQSLCRAPPHPVAALLINGTADPLVPYEGGDVHFFRKKRGTVLSIAQTVQFWLQANHIDPHTTEIPVTHRDVADNPTHAIRSIYGNDPAQAQVQLVKIVDGGHVEPSLSHHYGRLYEAIVGKQNRDLESADLAWTFFHDKRTP